MITKKINVAKCLNESSSMEKEKLEAWISGGAEKYIPNLSIDIAIIGFQEGKLKVLLQELDAKWFLPGGYIEWGESIDDAATRILKERTGIEGPYLEQFHVFGAKERSFKKEMKKIFGMVGWEWSENLWVNDRFVSIAYYALVDIDESLPTGGIFSQSNGWMDLKDLPEMWMDHKDIANQALYQLKKDISIKQMGFRLLPERFTMPELHRLHEEILDKKLDRSRFQKKMISLDIFERLPEMKEGVPHKRPYLYTYKK